jgi:hypothetical protein
MSSTPKSADDAIKLTDNGHTIVLRRSGLGSVYAVYLKSGSEAHQLVSDAVDKAIGWDGVEPEDGEDREFGDCMEGVVETDDFSVSQVLYRLTEKATTGRIV